MALRPEARPEGRVDGSTEKKMIRHVRAVSTQRLDSTPLQVLRFCSCLVTLQNIETLGTLSSASDFRQVPWCFYLPRPPRTPLDVKESIS